MDILTMKAEYKFNVVHPRTLLKFRRKYQNMSLTKKLACRAEIRSMVESLKKQTSYMPPMAGQSSKLDKEL